jgi:hypothetical protein
VKGYVFTAVPHRGSAGQRQVPPGCLRMNGPKKMMEEIKAHEGRVIEITGLMEGRYARR